MLAQKGKPIPSRILNVAERNYFITEKECLAVILGMHKFPCFFNELLVKVVMDYSALTKLTKGKSWFSRMRRWCLKLAL